MFNNANVIFRTKFVDGVSTVSRTIGTGSSKGRTLQGSENTMESEGSKKQTSRRGNRGKENAVVA